MFYSKPINIEQLFEICGDLYVKVYYRYILQYVNGVKYVKLIMK